MTSARNETKDSAAAKKHVLLAGSGLRTLEAIFRHPLAQNLEWRHVIALFETIGDVHQKSHNEYTFEIDTMHLVKRKPNTKDLTGPDVMDFRQFLTQTGWSASGSGQSVVTTILSAPSLMIVADHHEARIFDIDVTSANASEHVIKPCDPHHFLHHLTHKNEDREQGQRAPEDITFYERIAEAVSAGGKIIVVGHGTGKSNAADHLCGYLRTHHNETYRRIIREIGADLSSITTPQLLKLAQQVSLEG